MKHDPEFEICHMVVIEKLGEFKANLTSEIPPRNESYYYWHRSSCFSSC